MSIVKNDQVDSRESFKNTYTQMKGLKGHVIEWTLTKVEYTIREILR